MGCDRHGYSAECWCDRTPEPPSGPVLGCLVLVVVVGLVAVVAWLSGLLGQPQSHIRSNRSESHQDRAPLRKLPHHREHNH
jgi:hypothetical protein